MSEQFHVRLDSEPEAREAARRLSSLTVDGEPALTVEQRDASVFAGCGIFGRVDPEASLHCPGDGDPLPFFRLFYQVDGMKSGMHHPDGILWIRRPRVHHRVHATKVPLRDIAPTLLHLYGMTQPAYMRGTPLDV